jgi:hypothetical protein
MAKERKFIGTIDTTPTWSGILLITVQTLYMNKDDETLIEELYRMGQIAGVDTTSFIVQIVNAKSIAKLRPIVEELLPIAQKADKVVDLQKRNKKIEKIKKQIDG